MNDENNRGQLVEIDFKRGRTADQSAELAVSEESAKVLDLTSRLPRQFKNGGDFISHEIRDGEVNVIVRIKGRKWRFGDKAGTGNTDLMKWAEEVVRACRSADRARETGKTSDTWAKVLRGESCEPPKLDKWHIDALLEKVGKATALAVARSLWALDLDDLCCTAIAEDLTGRKMAGGSSPRTRGPSLEIRRDDLIFLVIRWRELTTTKGLTPMPLRLRDKTAEIALEAAKREQRESGVNCFGFHRRKGHVEVWLWSGGGGTNLTGRLSDHEKSKTKAAAITWAKSYAEKHGFPYVEIIGGEP